MSNRIIRPILGALTASVLTVSAAIAHHGWTWAEQEQIEQTGTIVDIYIGPPHPTLEVDMGEGDVWTVELGNPRGTERSGFVEGVARPGDEVVVLGHRSLDADERRMKAVRLTIGEDVYDIYPTRIHDG